MNRVIKKVFAAAIVLGVMGNTPAPGSGNLVVGNQTVRDAEHALAEALGKLDKTAVDVLLDEQFEWTDVDGKTRNLAAAIEELTALAANHEGETVVQTHSYAQLEIVLGFHHGARFSRIWVKRPTGWRALIFLDTAIPKQAAGIATAPATSSPAGDCENPCRTLPYTPATETDRAVLAEWQKTKMDEWHPDAEDWASHIAEEFLIINSNSERNKSERVAIARKQQESGVGVPGDPVVSMSMADFGDSAVMISRHAPYRGGKPYYNARVFVNRNGHWLIAWSQQTTIQSAVPLPAVAEKK
jgi:hypothetical protein